MSELLKNRPQVPEPTPSTKPEPQPGAPSITRPSDIGRVGTGRLIAAFAVAGVADLLTFLLGPLIPVLWGIPGLIIDIPTAAILVALLGFSPLLVIVMICELIPGAQMAPWWILFVAVVKFAPKILGQPYGKLLRFLLGRFK